MKSKKVKADLVSPSESIEGIRVRRSGMKVLFTQQADSRNNGVWITKKGKWARMRNKP